MGNLRFALPPAFKHAPHTSLPAWFASMPATLSHLHLSFPPRRLP